MERLYKKNNFRKYVALDKLWDFTVDPDNKGKDEEWFSSFPEADRRLPVPSCWNLDIDFFRYIGTAWYKTEFETESENIYIKFSVTAVEIKTVCILFFGKGYGFVIVLAINKNLRIAKRCFKQKVFSFEIMLKKADF